MQYQHSVEKANQLFASATGRMRQEGLTHTPDIFEVWYVYYSGEHAEVTRAIDVLVATGQKINDEECREIHNRFLSERTQQERVREAGDRIQSTIKDVNGVVGNVKEATLRYSATLGDVTSRLEGASSKDEIDAVLKNVMVNTQDMIRQNALLEEKLLLSSQVMKELQRDLELVRKEALTDGLTNLANRKAFDAEIRRVAQEAKDSNATFSLLMLDIDHFKSFNDNFGHQVGDQVLRLVARTLVEGVKGRDMAARFGGEEFAIILPDTNVQGAIKVGDILRKAVAGKEVVNRNTGDVLGRITLSGGAAEFVAGEKIEDLIERADAALYTAKHNGRNQVAAAPAPGQKRAKT